MIRMIRMIDIFDARRRKSKSPKLFEWVKSWRLALAPPAQCGLVLGSPEAAAQIYNSKGMSQSDHLILNIGPQRQKKVAHKSHEQVSRGQATVQWFFLFFPPALLMSRVSWPSRLIYS